MTTDPKLHPAMTALKAAYDEIEELGYEFAAESNKWMIDDALSYLGKLRSVTRHTLDELWLMDDTPSDTDYLFDLWLFDLASSKTDSEPNFTPTNNTSSFPSTESELWLSCDAPPPHDGGVIYEDDYDDPEREDEEDEDYEWEKDEEILWNGDGNPVGPWDTDAWESIKEEQESMEANYEDKSWERMQNDYRAMLENWFWGGEPGDYDGDFSHCPFNALAAARPELAKFECELLSYGRCSHRIQRVGWKLNEIQYWVRRALDSDPEAPMGELSDFPF